MENCITWKVRGAPTPSSSWRKRLTSWRTGIFDGFLRLTLHWVIGKRLKLLMIPSREKWWASGYFANNALSSLLTSSCKKPHPAGSSVHMVSSKVGGGAVLIANRRQSFGEAPGSSQKYCVRLITAWVMYISSISSDLHCLSITAVFLVWSLSAL